jgi:hypothetical protein
VISDSPKVFFSHRDGRLEAFDEPAGLSSIFGEYEYITSLAVALCLRLSGEIAQLVTTWTGNVVPHLERDTVLVSVGDERAQIPAGVLSARLALRTGSPKSLQLPPLSQRPASLLLLSAAREARNLGRRFSRAVSGSPLRTPCNVESIPIGYVGRLDLAPLDMASRLWSVSFAGGIGSRRVVGGHCVPLAAKSAARLTTVLAMHQLSAARPDISVRIIHPDMEPKSSLERREYHRLLQQTKISLCPRGNFAETFRLYESAQLGCAILCDPLPQCWYFADHPFIEVHDWRKLPGVVLPLLDNEKELRRRGSAAMEWWKNVACPAAVARSVAEKLLPAVSTRHTISNS